MRIYCPKCGWRPVRGSRWWCTCGNSWNTFQTRGLCLSCGKKWQVTQCLDCHRYSPHEDWYHGTDPEKKRKKRQKRKRERIGT